MPKSSSLSALDRPPREEQVLRLDVAVDDAARVRDAERLGRPARQRDGLGDGERPALEPRREVLALEPLHREVALARRRRCRGRRSERSPGGSAPRGSRLLVEALPPRGARARSGSSARPVAPSQVTGAVDRAHPARAGFGQQLKPARYDAADHIDLLRQKDRDAFVIGGPAMDPARCRCKAEGRQQPRKAQASSHEPTTVIGQLAIESPQTRSLLVWPGERQRNRGWPR